jgi:dimeric dUTPase (all-alpha-NTP-PPase superfamily)
MFQRQKQFQESLGKDIKYNQQFINEMTQALFVEIAESLQETDFKSWKKPKGIDIDKYREELIDCWHFLINLSLAAGMDHIDIYTRFVEKNEINKKRQKDGY